jgi:hypothetical protein
VRPDLRKRREVRPVRWYAVDLTESHEETLLHALEVSRLEPGGDLQTLREYLRETLSEIKSGDVEPVWD